MGVHAKMPKVGSGILEHWEQTYDPTKFAGFNVSQHHAYMANMSNDLFRLKEEQKGSSSEDSAANATVVMVSASQGDEILRKWSGVHPSGMKTKQHQASRRRQRSGSCSEDKGEEEG